MSKARKSLDELDIGKEFVHGKVEAEITDNQPKKEVNILTKLLEQTEVKESTVRFTVDMPESMHRKLSLFAARTNKKKSEIVRLLLEDALKQVSD